MLKIRLQRTGRKHESTFRIVLTDSKNGPQSGGFKEVLGSYNPKSNEKQVKADRVTYWMSQGAQVSNTVTNILIGEGIVKGRKINVLPKKSPVIDEEAVKAAAEAKEKAEADAKAKAEEEAKAAEEAAAAAAAPEEEVVEAPVVEEAKTEEAPAEEKKEEAPAEESAEEKA